MENRKSKFAAFLSSIIAGIIVAMIVYFGLNIAGFKEYKASAKLLTTSVETLSEENPAESFAKTLNSKAIRERTLENLKIDWPESKLENKLSIMPIKSSPIIDISVVDTNKQRAEDLADEYADLSATVINNIYNAGANVSEYSYKNAKSIDKTLNYATYAGVLGFVLYLIIAMVSVSRHNQKLEKNHGLEKKKEKAKTKKQVKKNKKAIEKKEKAQKDKKSYTEKQDKSEIEDEIKEASKEETRPLTKAEEEYEDDFATRKIDSNEIYSSLEENNKKADEDLIVDQDGEMKLGEEKFVETNLEEKSSNKLVILGKLPKYKRGVLDV